MSLWQTLRFITTHPINNGQKLRSLARFLRWQFVSRFSGTEIICPWIGGAKLAVRRGDHGLTGNIYCGLHELSEMALVLTVLRPGDLFADIGANYGSYTVLAAAVAGARCCSFEPHPTNYQHLLRNIQVNGIEQRVRALNIAVGAAKGTLPFSGGSYPTSHMLAPAESSVEAIEIPVETLDAVMASESPFMAKIDVEGYESQVLQGAGRILKDPSLKVLIVELNGSGERYGFDEASVRQMVHDFGFRPCRYEPIHRRLIPGTAGRGADNTIYARDLPTVAERIATARITEVLGVNI